MTNDRAWVNLLKPGDLVFVRTSSYRGCSFTPATVKTVGKLHITIEDIPHCKCKFNRSNLEETGKKHGRMYMGDPVDYLDEYSQENITEYQLQKKRDFCTRVIKWLSTKNMDKQTPETVEAYHNILITFKGDGV
jgi:hypothetical protein